ncbi:MAG TPA: hypothetical protein VJ965_02880, partial [Anaerolineales bacterium]|nr:hypothetical protein [Anaerolineales bacterium]
PAFSARTVYEVDRSNLGNAHSHFVLVEGDEYGDERVPMFNLFASFRRAAGLVVNGGPRAADEVRTAVGLGLPLVVVEGSGQLADELAQPTQAGEILTPAQAAALRNEGKFVFVDGETKAGTIGKVLEALFSF